MGARPAGELAYTLDCLGAPFAHHIGRAEFARKSDAVGMTAKEDDTLCTEALGGYHATQAHSTVTYDSYAFPGANLCDRCRVVPRAHDIRKCEQRRHKGLVLPDRKREECSICIRNPNCLGLCAIVPGVAEKSQVDASGGQAFVTEHAGTIGDGKRHDYQIATLQPAYLATDGFDHPDRFVPHSLARFGALHRPVRP